MAMAEQELHTGRSIEAEPQRYLFNKERYYQMAELGWFDLDRVELIKGEILEMAPIGTRHWTAVNLLNQKLSPIYLPDRIVSIQNPISIDDSTVLQPDFAVIEGRPADYLNALPETALLVIEVSDSTYARDRAKAALYAKADVPEYWIINLASNTLEVYRHPSADGGYLETFTLSRVDTISPLSAHSAIIKLADIIPGQ